MNTKDKLLETARQLIYKKGYHNTSIRDILEAAEAGKGQLYYYFDSKKSIGLAVINETINEWEHELFETTLAPSETPEKDFVQMLKWIYTFHEKQQTYYGCPMGNLIVELSLEDEEFRQLFNKFLAEWTEALSNKLLEFKGLTIDKRQATEEAELIISQIQGSIVLLKVEQDLRILERTFNYLEKSYAVAV